MTEPSYLTAVRESYDTVAADYARRVKEPAELDPVPRAMLAALAELAAPLGVVTTRVVQEPEGGGKRRSGTFLAYRPE